MKTEMKKKETGIAILVSNKTDFKTKAITREKKKDSAILLLDTYLKKTNNLKRYLHFHVCGIIIYNNQDMRTTEVFINR